MDCTCKVKKYKEGFLMTQLLSICLLVCRWDFSTTTEHSKLLKALSLPRHVLHCLKSLQIAKAAMSPQLCDQKSKIQSNYSVRLM